ncbi:MAG TPA: lipoprotein [Stellaceae bacterium]|nr:lipoprotein [Stellaceae bacterium]
MSKAPIASRRRPSPAARIVLALVVAAMLAGCGKKGNPVPPADEPNTFPQPYPKQ